MTAIPVTFKPVHVPAGPFSEWLRRMRHSLRSDEGMDVPCGDCVGCCVSGYSLQIRPTDTRALAQVSAASLVRPAGFAAEHLTLPPQADGRCQMLSGRRCTIYRDRPQTCLDYDCRIYTAAGLEAGGEDKAAINERVRAWRFDYPQEIDRREHVAVQATAEFIRSNRDRFEVRVPTAPMGIAVLAIKSYDVLLAEPMNPRHAAAIATSIVQTAQAFDRAREGGA